MNTKTSYKCAHNFYDGGNNGMGRDSPGALLDMLAEVASQTLHSEAIHMESDMLKKSKQKADMAKRKNHEVHLNLPQILSMPATQLVKHFAIFTSDELKRQYSYVCALVPGCEQKYTSFASEGKARVSIMAHLADHLDYLKTNKDSYATFKATAVKHGKPKVGIQSKKHKIQQLKKPQEIPNKENKLGKLEKSTSYLRKILSNEMNFKEFEKQKRLETQNREMETCAMEAKVKTDPEVAFKVLGDHSYYEHVTEEPIHDDMQGGPVNEAVSENIMLMVVESDSVHMKELPYMPDDIAGQSNSECNADFADSKSWADDICGRGSEIVAPAKPKGKAKFIGTSKEEREMALVLMERIKKKGNPTGSNLECRICDPPRSFTAPTTLVSHYRSHAGIKPYECRICRAVFTRRHSLKYHMLIHQNQTRFTCADCGKKFRHPSHFREHRRRHTGESPFGCDDCGQRFKTRNTYKRHLKTRHGKVLTTTGELLCLTEEEFQKVQTNRKRKSQSISSDVMAEEDAVATESIVQYVSGDFNENSQENNNDSIEDYHVQAMAGQNLEDICENGIIDIDKTEIIETEVELGSACFENAESSNNRVLYDGIVENGHIEFHSRNSHDEMLDHPGVRLEYVDERDDVSGTNDENVKILHYRDESPAIDKDQYIVPYDYDGESFVDSELGTTEAVNQNIIGSEDDETTFHDATDQQCAYKIQGNVKYQLHVVPQDSVEFVNSESYDQLPDGAMADGEDIGRHVDVVKDSQETEYGSVVGDDRLLDECEGNMDNSDESEISERPMVSQQTDNRRQTISIVPAVKNGRFLLLSNDDLKAGYLRIEKTNIIVKEVKPLASIAVPQKSSKL